MDAVAFTVDAMGPPAGSPDRCRALSPYRFPRCRRWTPSWVKPWTLQSQELWVRRRGIRGAYTVCRRTDCPITRTTGGGRRPTRSGAGMWRVHAQPPVRWLRSADRRKLDGVRRMDDLTPTSNAAGTHLIGTLFNGFATYTGANNVFSRERSPTAYMAPRPISGWGCRHLCGWNRIGPVHRLEANLTANVRLSMPTDPPATTANDDDTIAGRIDTFRGTDGVFLTGPIRRPIPTIRWPAERTTGWLCWAESTLPPSRMGPLVPRPPQALPTACRGTACGTASSSAQATRQ